MDPWQVGSGVDWIKVSQDMFEKCHVVLAGRSLTVVIVCNQLGRDNTDPPDSNYNTPQISIRPGSHVSPVIVIILRRPSIDHKDIN
jgi:hypothetical protein